ncbi:MAG: tetratricopeptide repeat protein [Methanothrix sp.]|nr:MAG: tetratricopeptide repeat protein [Methanothrix sp.]
MSAANNRLGYINRNGTLRVPAEGLLKHILETGKRLSQSKLWEIQRNFFINQGAMAWSQGVVPYFITSNSFIANSYARLVFGFLRDCVANKQESNGSLSSDGSRLFYFIELGSGSGCFAYHFLKKFSDILDRSSLKGLQYKYVMTDLPERNLEHWKSHPFFLPFIERGTLDFANFDAQNDSEIVLNLSGERLSPGSVKNPMVVIANYFFDSIPQDAFSIHNGELYETLIALVSSKNETDMADHTILKRLGFSFEDNLIDGDYYGDPQQDGILKYYQSHLADTNILFPSAAMGCMERLLKLCSGRMMMISSDKGYSREVELQDLGRPSISIHGSFSLMMNYHALGKYIEEQGGTFLAKSYQYSGIDVCAFLMGAHPGGWIETCHAFHDAMESFGPDDFFILKKGLDQNYAALDLSQILAFLRLSGWDSKVFYNCFPAIAEKIRIAPVDLQEEVHNAIQKTWDNYYPMVGDRRDVPYQMATLLCTMDRYSEALQYTERSLSFFGENPAAHYCKAVCYYQMKDMEEALVCIDKAIELGPGSYPFQEMRAMIRAEMGKGG